MKNAVAQQMAPGGVLRAAINYGNSVLAQKDPADGEPRGVSVDLARELSRRLELKLELVTFDAAGKVFEALKDGVWDVAFLARDPIRAARISFTAPYAIIEATYLVRRDASYQAVEELDRDNVRIAVGKGAAYDLYLTRALKHAQLMRATTSKEAIDLFASGGCDAAAGVRQSLESYARTNPAVRVLDGRFSVIEQCMGIPNGRPTASAYLLGFVEKMKASGFVAAALERSGQRAATEAPLADERTRE